MTALPIDNQRIQELYVQLNAIRKRIELLKLTAQDFSNDNDQDSLSAAYVDAVIVLFYRAIEEANELSYETKLDYPDIPWDQIRGMRNAVAHAYFKDGGLAVLKGNLAPAAHSNLYLPVVASADHTGYHQELFLQHVLFYHGGEPGHVGKRSYGSVHADDERK